MDEKWDQLILNSLGPAYDDYEYFEALINRVRGYYLPDSPNWEEIVNTTLKLTRLLVDKEWILVSDSNVSFTEAVKGTPTEIFNIIQSNWEKIGFVDPSPSEVMIYELSQAGKDYYNEHEWKRITVVPSYLQTEKNEDGTSK